MRSGESLINLGYSLLELRTNESQHKAGDISEGGMPPAVTSSRFAFECEAHCCCGIQWRQRWLTRGHAGTSCCCENTLTLMSLTVLAMLNADHSAVPVTFIL
jgi:hypothetical protein